MGENGGRREKKWGWEKRENKKTEKRKERCKGKGGGGVK